MQAHIEACQYNQALELIWRQILDPANQYADRMEPWKLVKTDKEAAKEVLYALVEQLRGVDPAQAVFAADGGDDLPQLQLPAAVGAGALRGRLAISGASRRSAHRRGSGGRQSEAAVSEDKLRPLRIF